MKQPGASLSKRASGQIWWFGCLALASLSLLVLLASQEVEATSIGGSLGDLTPQQSQQQSGDYNNLGESYDAFGSGCCERFAWGEQIRANSIRLRRLLGAKHKHFLAAQR